MDCGLRSSTEETPPRMHISRIWGSERFEKIPFRRSTLVPDPAPKRGANQHLFRTRARSYLYDLVGVPRDLLQIVFLREVSAGNEKPGLVPAEVYKYPMGLLLPQHFSLHESSTCKTNSQTLHNDANQSFIHQTSDRIKGSSLL